jgi:hypothetical protein
VKSRKISFLTAAAITTQSSEHSAVLIRFDICKWITLVCTYVFTYSRADRSCQKCVSHMRIWELNCQCFHLRLLNESPRNIHMKMQNRVEGCAKLLFFRLFRAVSRCLFFLLSFQCWCNSSVDFILVQSCEFYIRITHMLLIGTQLDCSYVTSSFAFRFY